MVGRMANATQIKIETKANVFGGGLVYEAERASDFPSIFASSIGNHFPSTASLSSSWKTTLRVRHRSAGGGSQ
jgi:hypothetical protein